MFFRMFINRDTTSIVLYFDTTIVADPYLNIGTISCQRFVDGIVNYLIHEMMKTTLTGGSNIHTRALADWFKPLKNLDIFSVVM